MLSSAKAELERVQSRGTELLQESLDAKARYNRKLKQLHARKDALTSLEDTLRSQTSDVAAAQRAPDAAQDLCPGAGLAHDFLFAQRAWKVPPGSGAGKSRKRVQPEASGRAR